jgi:hypothetical protein
MNNNIVILLKSLTKIAALHPESVSSIATQLAKIAALHPESVSSIATQLAKIAALHPESVSSIATQLAKIAALHPESVSTVIDSISDGQLQSKQWLADQLYDKNLGNIFLCGGWYATLLFDKKIKYDQCISFDVDSACKPIADILHKNLIINNWRFISATANINDIDYSTHTLTLARANGSVCTVTVSPDTIINTSCEHIENFNHWWGLIPDGKLIAVQSNNGFDIIGHINCHATLADFSASTPMTSVIFSGEREMPKFTRFMRIGYK